MKFKWGELIAVKTFLGWKVDEYKGDHDKGGRYRYKGHWYSQYRKATAEEVDEYIRSLENKLERAKDTLKRQSAADACSKPERYIRLSDGTLFDVLDFMDKERSNRHYLSYEFQRPKNEGGACEIRWTAVDAETKKPGEHAVSLSCEMEAQSDSLSDLCDCFVWVWSERKARSAALRYKLFGSIEDLSRFAREQEIYGYYPTVDYDVYGAVCGDDGIKYVAKMDRSMRLNLM